MNSHHTHTDHIDTDYIHPELRDLVHSVGLIGWTRIIVGNWAILGAIILGLFIHLKSVANFDQAVLNWVLTIRIDALTAFMKAVTHLFSPTVSVIEAVVIGLLIWAVSKSWRFGLFIPLVMAVSAVATSLVKLGIERVRPPIPERLVVELSHSFPSGHTTAASALAISAALLSLHAWGLSLINVGIADSRLSWNRRGRACLIWALAISLVALVATTRIYLAAHWTTDIIGGVLMGSGTALILGGLLLSHHSVHTR